MLFSCQPHTDKELVNTTQNGDYQFQWYVGKDKSPHTLQLDLKIGRLDGRNLIAVTDNAQALNQRDYYFSYLLYKDVSLVINGTEKVPCTFHQFEKNSNSKRQTFIQLVFDCDISESDDVTVVIDSEYINPLPLKFPLEL